MKPTKLIPKHELPRARDWFIANPSNSWKDYLEQRGLDKFKE